MAAPIVRFAPSPTGRIHVGNARPALINYLFARRHRGQFILRFDDTDVERSREEYAQAIEVDLAWLGIHPDLTFRQSQRIAIYQATADKLRAEGRLYPCYETAEELDRRRKRQQARGLPPIYDRAALKLTDADRAKLESEGRKPHWRFKLEHRIVRWNDIVRGESHIDSASLSDPVLIREHFFILYRQLWTILNLKSQMLSGARITSPTRRCKSNCSRRWVGRTLCRTSDITTY
jgi:glutamyl-tRNA synthetase